MRWLKVGLLFIFLTSTFISFAHACTDFRLTATDNTILISRSLEFGMDLRSNLMSSPRGKTFTETTTNGKPGLTWKSTYGYLFLDGLDTGYAIDGLNEQGLSIEALYLPGETEYQTVPAGMEDRGLSYLHFGDWILGNFKNIDEIKTALLKIFVFAQTIPQLKDTIFPLHFAITDNTGKSIIVEFVSGKIAVYDNKIGVLTNSPNYSWQITNLRNYINLSPSTPVPQLINGMTFVATGQGAGMMGLPGDVSPPSRFVKISLMLNAVIPQADATQTLNLAQHIMNNVDIPLGLVRTPQDRNKYTSELTQWVVFKDLTHKMFYYRTYGDMSLRVVDMSKVNFAEGAPVLKMSLLAKQNVIDMTQTFLQPATQTSASATVSATATTVTQQTAPVQSVPKQ